MDFNIAMVIASIVYLLLIFVFFFFKKRVSNIETKIYSYLLIFDLFIVLFDFLCILCAKIDSKGTLLYTKIAGRGFLVSIALWILIFTLYMVVITLSTKTKNRITKDIKTYKIFFLLILILNVFFVSSLPLRFFSDGKVAYTYGTSTIYLLALIALSVIISFYCVIKNRKHIEKKKVIPMFAFIISIVILVIARARIPELQITSAIFTFVSVLMFFTIEDPDINLIEELNVAKEDALKANNAKTDFLLSMSHNIRTPLNAIVGFSESLKEGNLTPEEKDEVEDIIEASTTLIDTVDSVLDISSIETNEIEIVDTTYKFKNIFNESVAKAKTRLGIKKPVEFRYHMAEDIPPILYGDTARVKQVISNLLTNAIKYTKRGYISFDVKSITKYNICRLIITVEDTGIGIKRESIDKLFDKFDRVYDEDLTDEGTGLGLAVTKKLVDLMHGKITVQSVYGKGSLFTVIIDQRVAEKLTPRGNREDPEDDIISHDLSNKKVLIVDDNQINIKVAIRMLRSYGFQIEAVESGFQCLELIKSGRNYDLIFMDDMMPKMTGTETFHKLQEIDGFVTPVVVLTANAISGMKEKYYGEGFDDFLAKPIEKNELKKMIKKFLDK